MDLNKATAHKAAPLLEAIQELHLPISHNMVVCLSNRDLNQPDRWLTSSLQANSLVNKAVMVVRPNPQVNMPIRKWDTEVLPALVDMAAGNQHLMLNGVHLPLKALEMALEVTKDNSLAPPSVVSAVDFRVISWKNSGYDPLRSLLFASVLLVLVFPLRLGRPA